MVLNQQFIQITDRAVYESQENNPDGEIHKEIGYISYDQNRQDHVLCEFHIEGYVNQYVLEDRTSESKKFVFITEITENILPGWLARTTYEIQGKDEFRETFELSGPDQEWSCFLISEFKRARDWNSPEHNLAGILCHQIFHTLFNRIWCMESSKSMSELNKSF